MKDEIAYELYGFAYDSLTNNEQIKVDNFIKKHCE